MTRIASGVLLALLALGTLPGCSGISVSHDYDEEVDFSGLEAYAWIEPPAGAGAHELSYRRVVSSADAVLAAKGFRLDPDAPDFLVAAHLGTERKVRVTDWGYGYRHGPGAVGVHDVDVDEYEEGTLVLDLVLADTKNLVWRGTARATVDETATPEERSERIQKAVERLLEPFPPSR